MHVGKRARRITGTGGKDKTAVIGILERGGKVKTVVIPNRRKKQFSLKSKSMSRLTPRSIPTRFSPMMGWPVNTRITGEYAHQVIDHAVAYVDGKVHTNGLEKFWSLLKRGISGTYVSVEPFHRFRYLDEQSFRYNNRKEMNDFDRFKMAASQIGKRLTWDNLTSKTQDSATCIN